MANSIPKPNPKNSKRYKPRSLSVTDSEWKMIRERAAAADLSVSRFLVERAIEPILKITQEAGPHPSWMRRAARDSIALGMLQRWRFAEQDREGEWDEIIDEAEKLVAEQESWQ